MIILSIDQHFWMKTSGSVASLLSLLGSGTRGSWDTADRGALYLLAVDCRLPWTAGIDGNGILLLLAVLTSLLLSSVSPGVADLQIAAFLCRLNSNRHLLQLTSLHFTTMSQDNPPCTWPWNLLPLTRLLLRIQSFRSPYGSGQVPGHSLPDDSLPRSHTFNSSPHGEYGCPPTFPFISWLDITLDYMSFKDWDKWPSLVLITAMKAFPCHTLALPHFLFKKQNQTPFHLILSVPDSSSWNIY